MKKATIAELEQRIVTIYDAHNGDIGSEDICQVVQRGEGCAGVECEACPLGMAYLVNLIRRAPTP